MPIMNYTTRINAAQTVGEIQAILAAHGAKRVIQDFDASGAPVNVSFLIDTPRGTRSVRLPVNIEGVHAALLAQKVKADRAQAERVAWRIAKDWLEAQMAILDAQMVQLDEIFLPYLLDSEGEWTLYEAYRNGQQLLGGREE